MPRAAPLSTCGPDDELPVNLSGLETLNMTWDLFETAAQMDDLSDRQEMLNFAKWWRNPRTSWIGSN